MLAEANHVALARLIAATNTPIFTGERLLDASVLTIRDGYLERTDRPGLGVEIDEAAVRAADERARPWRTPGWRHADGSFAEW